MDPSTSTPGVAGLLPAYAEAAARLHSLRRFYWLHYRFTLQYHGIRVLFDRWSYGVGLADRGASETTLHPQLKDEPTARTIKDLMATVLDIFPENYSKVSGADQPEDPEDSPQIIERYEWIATDSEKLPDRIERFDELVEKLHSVIPLKTSPPNCSQDSKSVGIREEQLPVRDQVISWLNVPSMDDSFDAYRTARLEGTCEWITSHSIYSRWLENDSSGDSKVLWIHGPAGTGKSVLSAHVIQTLRDTTQLPVYYAFCSADFEERRNPTSILSTWLLQALHFDDFVYDIIHNHPAACITPSADHSDLLGLLNTYLSRKNDVVLVIDGLDECFEDGDTSEDGGTSKDSHPRREDLLRQLLATLANTKARVLVMSRDEGDISDQLASYAQHPLGVTLLDIPLTKRLVSSDIVRFAQHTISKQLPDKEPSFLQDLALNMGQKCDGVFLWIRLQSRYLEPHKSNEELQDIVSRMPTTLFQTYERDLSIIQSPTNPHRKRAETILRWVVFASAELTVVELSEAVEVLGEENNKPNFDALSTSFTEAYIQSEILGPCGSFLKLRPPSRSTHWGLQTVHLVHFSALEFFCNLASNDALSNQPLQHYRLASACLKYLDCESTWAIEQDFETFHNRPFQAYATPAWEKHQEYSASYQPKLIPQLLSFFSVPNLNWEAWRERFESSLPLKGRPPKSKPGSRMYYAVSYGLLDIVKLLHATDLTVVDEVGGLLGNPIHAAIFNGRTEILELLLSIGADISLHGFHGTALHTAAAFGGGEVAKLLLKHAASITPETTSGGTSVCALMSNQRADPRTLTVRDVTPLHLAASMGNARMVHLLLDHGAELEAKCSSGSTALHYASGQNHFESCETLVNAGANVSARDNSGSTPLHAASHLSGADRLIRLLVDRGADPSASEGYGYTPLHHAASSDQCATIKYLLQCGSRFVATKHEGSTPLHTAAIHGNCEAAKLLLKFGVDIRNNFLLTPLHNAAYHGHPKLAKLLLDHDADIEARHIQSGTSVHLAAARGHYAVVKVLLDYGANPNSQGPSNFTPLHGAAAAGHYLVVELLLDSDADPSAKGSRDFTPLHFAARSGHHEVVQLLLKFGSDINVIDENSENSLHAAAYGGHDQIAGVLLEAGADPLAVSDIGWTPLHSACEKGSVEVIKLLLSAGAGVDSRSNSGWTPLHVACHNGHARVVEMLMRAGADIHSKDQRGRAPLHAACDKGSTIVLEHLLSAGANVNAQTEPKWTPLHYACQRGHAATVELLIRAGADLNLQEEEGFPPLYIACQNGYTVVVELLIKAGADLNVQGHDGCTPLFIASQNGHAIVVELLIKAGADLNLQRSTGTTPLHVACSNGRATVVNLLASSEADTDLQDDDGCTALHIACTIDNSMIVELLISAGADIAARKDYGWMPLHLACFNDQAKATKLLIDAGADIEAQKDSECTPLHVTCSNGCVKATELLINAKANIQAQMEGALTPLHLASMGGHLEVVELLVTAGVDMEARERTQCTPLHLASSSGCEKVVGLLLNCGVCLEPQNRDGSTPLHEACKHRHAMVVELLIIAGAAIESPTHDGRRPLHYASKYGPALAVELLIAARADIHCLDDYRSTPLHYACEKGHTRVADLLISAGSDIESSDMDDWTPLIAASRKGQTETVRQLLQAGAAVNKTRNDGKTPLHSAFIKKHKDTALALLGNHASLKCLDAFGFAPWEYGSAAFRADIPQSKDCEDPTPESRRQRRKQTVQDITGALEVSGEKNRRLLNILGSALLAMDDQPAASLAFSHALCIDPETGKLPHFFGCQWCLATRVLHKTYMCTTCLISLCAKCMERYDEEGGFENCVGHDFFCLPPDDWKAEDYSDTYTQEFVDWSKEIALKYRPVVRSLESRL